MRRRLLVSLALLLGCGSPPEEDPAPAAGPTTEAPTPAATERPAARETPAPAASASPRPEPSATASPRPTPSPTPTYVEPKPRPFADGRPSWRQEPWWELKRTGALPTVVYKVGALYGVMPSARWARGPAPRRPRPPAAWLDERCPRCSIDANPAGNPPPSKGPIDLGNLEEELSDADQAKVETDFRAACGTWPKGAKLDVASDGWVTLTNRPRAHLSVQRWLRHKLCGHRKKN